MTIVCQQQPVGGRELVHGAVNARRQLSLLPSLRGSPQVGSAIPVYRLSRHSVSLPKPLSRARKIGWRYPIVRGDAPGFVALLKKADRLEFGGIHEGSLAKNLLDAAALAKQALPHTETFEPRILEVPSLRLHALWMFAPRAGGRFISLIRGRAVGQTTQLQIADNFDSLIKTGLPP
jgi:hypothetical protein